ncbi:methyl-accepting chemotaxis protein [Chelatococcus sp. SYSU_G07232]|uniref:Methyl-accepting chemotaxis protein n=1 Tax=Chelatococcus albus TaxID=3047466 RepID=A0ABT7AFS6_9HYPH|nr:methyl-accepting chemotaxis protein [Chelatococcus sp. SYSU_G07232]MDJ1158183.1 methyl-accepting chemotaxis protein [Chelatococcus sp. SYSU_G07232]
MAVQKSPAGLMFRLFPRRVAPRTSLIVAVLLAINTALLTVSATWMIGARMREDVIARQSASMRTAAAILKERFPDAGIVASGGKVARIVMPAIPEFKDHAIVDQVSFATEDTATVFEWDAATGEFVRRTTSVKKPDGSRAVGTVLGKAGAVHPVVAAGNVYTGEADILGTPYYTQYVPIATKDGKIIGVLYVGTKKAIFEAARGAVVMPLLAVCVAAGVVVLLVALVLIRRALKPLGALAAATTAVATGDGVVAIPCGERADEYGDMARALAVFQGHTERLALADRDKLEQEARARRERSQMMTLLADEIGTVVDAAAQGDFSRRVSASFADVELQHLADGLNHLVSTVATGLDETASVLQTLTRGDLSARVTGDFRGSFAILKHGTNTMADRLTVALRELSEAASGVRTATREIAAGVNDLAERTADQASTANETCSALSTFAATVQRNAAQASEAHAVAGVAEQRAREGRDVLQSARDAMTRIHASSSRISDIIDIIDGIAFQTNLLALNAAVEAARAGEVGKGFAVVAAEVRTLAQGASEASNEIKALVTQAQNEVSSGVSLVEATAEKLGGIFQAISDVTALMSGITRSSGEQAAKVADLSRAVDRMGDMAQQNAALVEETHAAITVTEQQTQRLEELASQFDTRLHGTERKGQASGARQGLAA